MESCCSCCLNTCRNFLCKRYMQLADNKHVLFLIACNNPRSSYLQWFQYHSHPSWWQTCLWHCGRNLINILSSWYYSLQRLEIPYHMSLAIMFRTAKSHQYFINILWRPYALGHFILTDENSGYSRNYYFFLMNTFVFSAI